MKMHYYRQGDVAIQRVDSIPANLSPIKPENGKVILAHGEVTGHHHALDCAVAEKLTDESGAEYFRINGIGINGKFLIVRRWNHQVMINHPKHGLVEFAVADVRIEGDAVILDGDYGLLTHQEHNTQAIPAGLYIGGGADKKVRQREYTPEAIRNVAD